MNHTKEPWNFIHNNFQFSSIYSGDSLIAECIIHNSVNEENEFDLVEKKEADARRIVACVNACAGLETDFLESIVLTGENLKLGIAFMMKMFNMTELEVINKIKGEV